jgi:hypothetical protein
MTIVLIGWVLASIVFWLTLLAAARRVPSMDEQFTPGPAFAGEPSSVLGQPQSTFLAPSVGPSILSIEKGASVLGRPQPQPES